MNFAQSLRDEVKKAEDLYQQYLDTWFLESRDNIINQIKDEMVQASRRGSRRVDIQLHPFAYNFNCLKCTINHLANYLTNYFRDLDEFKECYFYFTPGDGCVNIQVSY